MGNETDLILTYDIRPFMKSVKIVKRTLGNIATKAGDFTKKAAKASSSFLGKAGGMAKSILGKFSGVGKAIGISIGVAITAALAIAAVGIKAILSKIPEIGQAFSIAGDIAMRNFLEPLRRFLIPMLMNMIKWVRENRTTFVKWGTAFANAFRAIIQVLKIAINLVKIFFKTLVDSMGGIFKDLAQDTAKTLNMIIFKIAAIFIFIGALLKPYVKSLARIVASVFKILGAFGKGVLKGLLPIFKVIGGLVFEIEKFFISLSDKAAKAKGILKFFELLGYIVGNVLVTYFRYLKTIVMAVMASLSGLIEGIVEGLGGKKGLAKIEGFVKDVFKAFKDLFKWLQANILPILKEIFKVIGIIIGKIIHGIIEGIKEAVKIAKGLIDDVKNIAVKIKEFFTGKTKKNVLEHTILGSVGVGTRASGGPVSGGSPYIVGEKGPELIIPNSSGTVIPANQTAKMGRSITVPSINISLNINGPGDPMAVAQMIKDQLGDSLMSVFNKLEQAEA